MEANIIPHPTTGEAIDLATATDEQIVAALESANEVTRDIKSLRDAAAVELTRRLDRSGSWTRRVEVDGLVFEIKAASPTAGTETYPVDDLEAVVARLVEEGTIDHSAASAALEFGVTVKFTAADRESANEIEAQAKTDERVASVEITSKVKQAGINALSKIPGAAEAVAAVKITADPLGAERRPAKVSVKS